MTFREELEMILEKELITLTRLKELSFEKTDMIINNQIQILEKTTKEEEALVNEMALLENQREKLLDTWGVAINTPISDVVEKIPEDNTKLIKIKNEMTEIFEELYVRNTLNSDLIRENLDWIDFNINLMTNSVHNPNYGKDNEKSSRNSIFDRKV